MISIIVRHIKAGIVGFMVKAPSLGINFDYHCAIFGASNPKHVVILLQSSNDTQPLPLGLKCVPPGRIRNGFIAEIDQLIEYNHSAKFGASKPKDVVILLQSNYHMVPTPHLLCLECDPLEESKMGP